jgi:hypothetical protein
VLTCSHTRLASPSCIGRCPAYAAAPMRTLRRVIDRTDLVPAVNQAELRPYFTQPALRESHAQRLAALVPMRRRCADGLLFVARSASDAPTCRDERLVSHIA